MFRKFFHVDLGECYFICKDAEPCSSGFISMVWLLMFLIWREFWWLYFFTAHLM